MREISSTTESIVLIAVMITLVVLSVIAIIVMEVKYPTSDLNRMGPAKRKAASGDAEASATAARPTRAPRLAPRWLERVMAFVYPASMGIDEGIAHMWLRADTSMMTQCDKGGCENSMFVTALAIRWSASVATSFWLIVVFRRYETTVALPIEYGVATFCDVLSGLIFYQEYKHMSDCARTLRTRTVPRSWGRGSAPAARLHGRPHPLSPRRRALSLCLHLPRAAGQLALVISGCVLFVIGVAVGIMTCGDPDEATAPEDPTQTTSSTKGSLSRFQPSLPRLSHVVSRSQEEEEEEEGGGGDRKADGDAGVANADARKGVASVSASGESHSVS